MERLIFYEMIMAAKGNKTADLEKEVGTWLVNSHRIKAIAKLLGLERGPLSLVTIIVELLEWKVAAPVWKKLA
jgi:hypothetical protein